MRIVAGLAAGTAVLCGAFMMFGRTATDVVSAKSEPPAISSDSGQAWKVLREHAEAAPPVPQQAPAKAPVAPQRAPDATQQVFVPTQDRPVPWHVTVQSATDRTSLTSALQRELKRVGCYTGEINGVWTPSTRHASEAFLVLANAKLPLTGPDPALLALVQASTSTSCPAPCRPGRTSTGNCRETIVAGVPVPGTDKSGEQMPPAAPPASGFEPPMGLNGPATMPPETEKKAAPRPPRRNASHARGEDWRAKLWRNPGG
jgi:hypothetical protein